MKRKALSLFFEEGELAKNAFRITNCFSLDSFFPFSCSLRPGNARMRVLGSRAPLRRLLEELLVCSPSTSTKLGSRARTRAPAVVVSSSAVSVSSPSTSSHSASSSSSLCCYARSSSPCSPPAAAASRVSTPTSSRHAVRRSSSNSNSVSFFKVAAAAAASSPPPPPPPPSSSSSSSSSSQQSQSFGMQSRARVYADANVDRPREYWDYEALTVEWG